MSASSRSRRVANGLRARPPTLCQASLGERVRAGLHRIPHPSTEALIRYQGRSSNSRSSNGVTLRRMELVRSESLQL